MRVESDIVACTDATAPEKAPKPCILPPRESPQRTAELNQAVRDLSKNDDFSSRFVRYLLDHGNGVFSRLYPYQVMSVVQAGLADPDIFRELAEFCSENREKVVSEPAFRSALEMLAICEINQTEESRLAAVSQNGLLVRHIVDPSEDVQIAAVRRTGDAIKYICSPSEKVQLEAVAQNGHAVEHIANPSEAVQLAAVAYSPEVIDHIKEPSAAVQLAARQSRAVDNS